MNNERRTNSGSALILAVVLTSLLAIIGTVFLMVARVDNMSTSAIAENKQLNYAVDTVVAKISQVLAEDVNFPAQEYYDYPDVNNPWLAALEPNNSGANYYWPQISDVTGFLNNKGFSTQKVNVKPVGLSTTVYVREYPAIRVNSEGVFLDDGTGNIAINGVSADADGDGIADSKWVDINDITTGKGKKIYTAIRIIDNGGMLNVNTAYKFDPSDTEPNVNGSTQLQVNLNGLAKGADTIGEIDTARNPTARSLLNYQNDVIWKIGDPNSIYRPFDMSDELELKCRYCIDSRFKSRIEKEFDYTSRGAGDPDFGNLYDGTDSNQPNNPCYSNWKLKDWQRRITEPNDCKADRRHLLTTYNMDRVIDPNGNKMVNINTADANSIYRAVRAGFVDFDPNFVNANGLSAQIAANIVDFRDIDSDVTVFSDPNDPNAATSYGFETPCVYISELVHRFVPDAIDPNLIYKSYAVELYKPYSGDNEPNGWSLQVGATAYPISWTFGRQFYVMRWQDPNHAPLSVDPNSCVQDSNAPPVFSGSVSLLRPVTDSNSVSLIPVDSTVIPAAGANWLVADANSHSIQRDISKHKCIRRIWDPNSSPPTLGLLNAYATTGVEIQAHPENRQFTNIGEIGMVFRKSGYANDPNNTIGSSDDEVSVRVNLADPNYQRVFKYLTVFDPSEHSNPLSETRVKGRININTAPWYVLAQLPWVSQRTGSYENYALAKAIVNCRGLIGGFKNIGELVNVYDPNDPNDVDGWMNYYTSSASVGDLTGYPDLTRNGIGQGDGAADDFEERDVIFSRISNLVTVRSDVFTAYILVRIGTDGPQKRMMAIFDRSEVTPTDKKVKVVSLWQVPDPR